MDDDQAPHLPRLDPPRKGGDEQFHLAGNSRTFDLLSFWQWSASDLVSNAQRGVLAEYLVAQAVGAAGGVRTEWDAFDVLTPGGIKIEVKSSAYVQAWSQSDYSKITFDIAPKRSWDAGTNRSSDKPLRSADVYVFAIHAHKDQGTLDPLDFGQWEFYVLSTGVLDERRRTQKSITLGSLLKLDPHRVNFDGLGEAILESAGGY